MKWCLPWCAMGLLMHRSGVPRYIGMEWCSAWMHPLCCSSTPQPLSALSAAHLLCVLCQLCDPDLPCPLIYLMPCILSVSLIHLLPFTFTVYRMQWGFERVAAAPQIRLRERQSGMSSCSNQTEQQRVPSPISGSTGTEALCMAKCGLLILISLLSVQLLAAGSTWDPKSLHVSGWWRGKMSLQGQLREGRGKPLIVVKCNAILYADELGNCPPVQRNKSLLMQFQYGCSVAPPTFVVLKLNTFVYKSLKWIAKTYVLAVIADVNLFVILQRLGKVFHKYVRSSIKILWQAARVENTTVTSQQGMSTLTHNSLVIDGISVPCSFLEMW